MIRANVLALVTSPHAWKLQHLTRIRFIRNVGRIIVQHQTLPQKPSFRHKNDVPQIAAPVKFRAGPITGFDRARTGIWAHEPVMPHGRPYKSRTGPSQDLKGHPFDLAMGKPWAIPYGARTGLKWGCPCPEWPRCACGAPYQSRTGSVRERYVGHVTFVSQFWQCQCSIWNIYSVLA